MQAYIPGRMCSRSTRLATIRALLACSFSKGFQPNTCYCCVSSHKKVKQRSVLLYFITVVKYFSIMCTGCVRNPLTIQEEVSHMKLSNKILVNIISKNAWFRIHFVCFNLKIGFLLKLNAVYFKLFTFTFFASGIFN